MIVVVSIQTNAAERRTTLPQHQDDTYDLQTNNEYTQNLVDESVLIRALQTILNEDAVSRKIR